MKNERYTPPAWCLRFFRWFCKPSMAKYIEGDLIELYAERRRETSRWKADARVIFDILLLFRPGIIRAFKLNTFNETVMLKNYLTVGVRNLLKYKSFSFINIFGLSLAMAVSMLVILMLADAGRYDRFHEKGDRIVRVLSGTEQGRNAYATSPYPLAAALKEYPMVEQAVNLLPAPGGDALYNNRVAEIRGYFADPAFFEIFSFDLSSGEEKSALRNANSIIISSKVAEQLFGQEHALGKVIEYADRQLSFPIRSDGSGAPAVSWGLFTVTGVIDLSKYPSHIDFDMLISSATTERLYTEKKLEDRRDNWEWYYRTYTFVLLKDSAPVDEFDNALNDFVGRQYKEVTADHLKGFYLKAQPLSEIQLGLKGNDTNTRLPLIGYYFVGALALVILISATFNFTNLSIARALTRAKEIGIRKVNGAQRRSLIVQFLVEAILTSFIALGFALILLNGIRPLFKGLWVNQFLQFELAMDSKVYLFFVAFALCVGILAGLFPALNLSRFQPVKVLKKLDQIRPGKFQLRKFLIVVQFVISIMFITTSIVVFNQFRHYMEFDYGFNSTGVMHVELQGADFEKVKHEMGSVSGVQNVSAVDVIPGLNVNNGMAVRQSGSTLEFNHASIIHTDPSFFDNLNLKLLAGKRFGGEPNSIVVNEQLVRKLGFKHPGEIVGQTLESQWGNELLTVSGVVADFRHLLLLNSDEVTPLVLRNNPGTFKYAQIRLAGSEYQATLTRLEEKWKRIDPIHPIKYAFYDDDLAGMHQGIFDLVSIVGFIAFMAVVISCLGLLGITTYSVERKKKEVGIRKVLGAREFSLAVLLSKEFFIMLGISVAIAGPLSYLFNNAWLQTLPNRVDFSILTVFTGCLALIVLGLLTIATQTLRAAKHNPVEVLKSE